MTPKFEVLDCHRTVPDPLTRRRLPAELNWKVPAWSTETPGPPAFQMATLEKEIAATKDWGLSESGRKEKEKFPPGDCQEELELALRVVPRDMSADKRG